MIANPGDEERQLATPQSSSSVFIGQASTDRALVNWVCDQVEAMGMCLTSPSRTSDRGSRSS